jgi:3-oxoacyl-[acyl-carrier protein] reductase
MRRFLTGASTGIGAATARRLALPGEELVLHYHRHRGEAERLAAELEARGAKISLRGADLADPGAVERLGAEVGQGVAPLDGLVLNAGSYPRRPFAEITPQEFAECLAVNLVAPARLLQLLLPSLRAATAPRVVLVASMLAFTGSRHGAHYAAAKAGLVGLARSVAQELGPSIAINVVAPGPIDTAILAGDTPAQRAHRESQLPLRRIGRPEEVAEAVAFLLSPSSAFMTGATLHVNGGAYFG